MSKTALRDDMDNLYAIIAENIRKERKRQRISREALAERADISVDTVKNVEGGRGTMRLDTYLRIARALGTTPMSLIRDGQQEEYVERFCFLVAGRDESEVEFALHMVEQLLAGRDRYLE